MFHRSKFFPVLALALAACLCAPVLAQDGAPAIPPVAENASTNLALPAVSNAPPALSNAVPLSTATNEPPSSRFDRFHDNLSTNLVQFVNRIDRFFGNEPLVDDNRATVVQLGAGIKYSDNEGPGFASRSRARVALPCLENRLQLVFDNDATAENVENSRPAVDAIKDSHPFAGLRHIFDGDSPFRLNSDVGLQLGSTTKVFVRTKALYTVPVEKWECRLSQSAGWFSDDGFKEVSEMQWSRSFKPGWMFRSSTYCTVRSVENGVEPEQILNLVNEFSPRTAYDLELYTGWPNFPHTTEALYKSTLTVRRLLYSHWFFVEVAPGIEFPQKDDYAGNPFITIRFDFIFGAD